jgi:universal stress protein A
MNVKSILLPIDFSHYTDAALAFASKLAAEARAKLFIIHVHDVRNLDAGMGEGAYLYAATMWEDQQREAEKRLREVVPTVAGVTVQHECLVGSPVPQILQFANSHEIDLIVMASHGRTGLSRLLMGSVAEGVVRKAQCPVLIVKQPFSEPSPSADREARPTSLGLAGSGQR